MFRLSVDHITEHPWAMVIWLCPWFFLAVGCSESSPCLDKLHAEVAERCRSVSEDECHELRRQQLTKIKLWDALTDDEKMRASEQCEL